MKLELKNIAPYLPYGLKCKYVDEDKLYTLDAVITETNQDKRLLQLFHVLENPYSCKIILHPLSDLTKEIEVNGEKFVPLIKFGRLNINESDWDRLYIQTDNKTFFNCMFNTGGEDDDLIVYFDKSGLLLTPYDRIIELLEWHFDVFGLIKEGLAIDINTLNK